MGSNSAVLLVTWRGGGQGSHSHEGRFATRGRQQQLAAVEPGLALLLQCGKRCAAYKLPSTLLCGKGSWRGGEAGCSFCFPFQAKTQEGGQGRKARRPHRVEYCQAGIGRQRGRHLGHYVVRRGYRQPQLSLHAAFQWASCRAAGASCTPPRPPAACSQAPLGWFADAPRRPCALGLCRPLLPLPAQANHPIRMVCSLGPAPAWPLPRPARPPPPPRPAPPPPPWPQ